MANLGTIWKREDRSILVGPFDSLPPGAESWNYSMGFRLSKEGADLATVTFGTAERITGDDGAYYWRVPMLAAKTTLLQRGHNQVAIWRTGDGTKTPVNGEDDTVMVLDRPGNA